MIPGVLQAALARLVELRVPIGRAVVAVEVADEDFDDDGDGRLLPGAPTAAAEEKEPGGETPCGPRALPGVFAGLSVEVRERADVLQVRVGVAAGRRGPQAWTYRAPRAGAEDRRRCAGEEPQYDIGTLRLATRVWVVLRARDSLAGSPPVAHAVRRGFPSEAEAGTYLRGSEKELLLPPPWPVPAEA